MNLRCLRKGIAGVLQTNWKIWRKLFSWIETNNVFWTNYAHKSSDKYTSVPLKDVTKNFKTIKTQVDLVKRRSYWEHRARAGYDTNLTLKSAKFPLLHPSSNGWNLPQILIYIINIFPLYNPLSNFSEICCPESSITAFPFLGGLSCC